jgi:sugar/nucleoside kinase (ribokinase family)
MLKSKNIFVCIGAIHHDYLLNLKKNIINFRSNQITQKNRIGGVAYNIAELLSNFVDVNFYSLAINEEIRKKISKKIYVHQVNKDYADRYYLALSDKNNKFLLGLANTDEYENNKSLKIPNIKNKNIIFDLNFSKTYLEKSINKLSKKNKIIVCATSVHKVIKIKRIINKVDFIFLNKAELLKLTNSSNIILGVKKILKQNKKIKIITTNSKNNVIFGSNEFIKKIKPPSIKVVNENGAGDALAAMMLYLFSINEKMNYILKTSVACGSYYASGKSLKTKSDFLKIKNLSKRVIVQ